MKIPVYRGKNPETISRQAAKLLVKHGRAVWVDANDRGKGVIALPKDLAIRQLPDGSIIPVNGKQHPADPVRYRQRFIDPSDQLLYALRLPNTHPRKEELLIKARLRFNTLNQ